MEKRLLPIAEKRLAVFKFCYAVSGIIGLMFEIDAMVKGSYSSAFIMFCVPVGICTVCFIVCAIEYLIFAGVRKYLYQNGVPIEGTVKRIENVKKRGTYSYAGYYLVATYVYQGKKRRWKSPLYEEDLLEYFGLDGICRLHVKNRLVCLDEEQMSYDEQRARKVSEMSARREQIARERAVKRAERLRKKMESS